MTVLPHPPTRQCLRFNKDGSRCVERTASADGWCRSCDGFIRAEAGLPEAEQVVEKREKPEERQPSLWQVSDALSMETNEAYEVAVSQRAINCFIEVHGGDRRAAEAQIRSLLEDLLLPGVGTVQRHVEKGLWRLSPARQGYLVTLNAETSVVIGYQTLHRERTYAQWKAGVPSRIKSDRPRTRPRKEKGWFLAAQEGRSFVISSAAAYRYAREELDMQVTRANVAEVLDRAVGHLERSGLTLPVQEGESRFTDPTGLVWTIQIFPGHRPYLSWVTRNDTT